MELQSITSPRSVATVTSRDLSSQLCCGTSVPDAEEVDTLLASGGSDGWPSVFSKNKHDQLMAEHGIPGWAYSRQVSMLTAQVRNMDGMPNILPMMCVCGPAVRLGRLAVCIVWPAIWAVGFAGYRLSACDHDLLVRYPDWLWAMFAPVIVLRIWIEIRILRYPLVPYVQVTERLTLAVFKPPFQIWLLAMGCLSGLQMVDLVTDSLFLSTAFRLQNCAYEPVDHAMSQVAKTSIFGKALGPSFHENVSLRGIAAMFYLLSLIQILVSLLEMTPRHSEKVDYDVACDPPSTAPAEKKIFMYSTYMTGPKAKTNHFEAMVSAAEATGMTSISKMAMNYPYCKAKFWMKQKGKVPFDVLQMHMSYFLRGGSKRAFFSMFLESAFQINLQVTLMGMNMALSKSSSEINYQALFSIIISISVSIFDSGLSAYTAITRSTEIMSAAKQQIDAGTENAEFEAEYNKLWRLRLRLIIFVVLTKLMVLYAMVKLYFVFVCEDSMWNLTGCVDLHFTHHD